MSNTISRVLIVDDLPVNRMILSSYLASRGVMSDQAQGGYECLELCRKNDYDLVLLDHRMPDLDGVDTLTQLKEIFSQKRRTTPVICHTTEEARNNINLYKAAGFADVLLKPIDPIQLSDIIMTYLPDEKEQIPSSPVRPAESSTEENTLSELSDKDEIRDELDKLPIWLKTVPHIDLNAGIMACGSAEDYIDALCIFRASAEAKANNIAKNLSFENWSMYRIDVHSLKSISRLIGALSLSKMAATLEECADNSEHKKIRQDTPELLREYRKFAELLEPLAQHEDSERISKKTGSDRDPAEEAASKDLSHSVLFIQARQGAFTKGIEKNLESNGFKVTSVPDTPDLIISHRFDADIILYYLKNESNSHIELTMNFLGEICQDDSKILCITGDVDDIREARKSKGFCRVSHIYPRPMEITDFLTDMERYSDLIADYHRMKNVFVVDDDPDYLSVIERWLSPHINVSCFAGGKDLLSGIETMVPDLILLDYEMPGMDGIELIKSLRSNDVTKTIPVIFLTGKNDRDHVFSTLHYKPDGYLLKSDSRDAIVDSVKRFFAESFFRKSLLGFTAE